MLPFIMLFPVFLSSCLIFGFPFFVRSRDANDVSGNPRVPFSGGEDSPHVGDAVDNKDNRATNINIDCGVPSCSFAEYNTIRATQIGYVLGASVRYFRPRPSRLCLTVVTFRVIWILGLRIKDGCVLRYCDSGR